MKLQRKTHGVGGRPTLGVLTSNDGVFTCVTLERSADGDHPCIPAGSYAVHRATHHPGTPHAYPCPELNTDSIGRSHIQIHIANRVSELLGCIAPGERVSDDRQAVEHSGDAFQRLMQYLTNVGAWRIEIVDAPALPTENTP